MTGDPDVGKCARITLQVALECVQVGYSASRIVERLKEEGLRVKMSDVHPYAQLMANEADRVREWLGHEGGATNFCETHEQDEAHDAPRCERCGFTLCACLRALR